MYSGNLYRVNTSFQIWSDWYKLLGNSEFKPTLFERTQFPGYFKMNILNKIDKMWENKCYADWNSEWDDMTIRH